MFFDILFMIKHYILYPNHEEPAPSTRLLDDVEKYDVAHISSNNLQAVKTPYSSLLTNNPYINYLMFHFTSRDWIRKYLALLDVAFIYGRTNSLVTTARDQKHNKNGPRLKN